MLDYGKLLSPKIQVVKPSGIRRFFSIVEEMEDGLSLGIGEPDFPTPWHIRDAGIYSLEKGKTKYTANAGIMELRRQIAAYLARRFGLSYRPEDEILVTVGGSEGIDACIRALVTDGDEVIIPEPSFVCYYPITTLSGGAPVVLRTRAEDGFRVTPEALRECITPRTKLLILPYPNNPTGAIMRRGDLEAVAEVLRGTNVMVLSDEIYAELTYGGRHVSAASVDGMRERTVVVNGFSKAYSMTGWRLGYACGPAPVIESMNKVHQYAIMCAPTTSQYAAVEALKNGDEDIEHMVGEYDMRRKYLVDALKRMGLPCFEPLGAFYVFPCIKGTGLSSEEFCEKLLYDQKLALIPGNAFGGSGEGFVRVSYAYSIKHIAEALRRLELFLRGLKGAK